MHALQHICVGSRFRVIKYSSIIGYIHTVVRLLIGIGTPSH